MKLKFNKFRKFHLTLKHIGVNLWILPVSGVPCGVVQPWFLKQELADSHAF